MKFNYSPATFYVDQAFKKILVKSILINRNTPRGEPAIIYERMPYDGRRCFVPVGEILKDRHFRIASCVMTPEHRLNLIRFMRKEGLRKDPHHLWHDGRRLRRGLWNWKPHKDHKPTE